LARFGCFKNGFIEINGVNLSDHCTEFSIEDTAEELPDHAHGDDVAQITPGLFNWRVTGKFLQDFAAGSVDATLYPLKNNRTKFAIRMRPDAGVVSPTNPMYSGMAYLTRYAPLQGPHGQNLMSDFTIGPASALARLTT